LVVIPLVEEKMVEEHEQGRDNFESEQAYELHCLRHSTAHVMAQAIMDLYPEASLAIGPPIKDGFYYDVEIPEVTLSDDDLPSIQSRMKKIVKQSQTFEHEEWTKEEAKAYFGEHAQTFKLELIDGIDAPKVHIYRNKTRDGRSFIDLCAGPHVDRTSKCKHHKLLKVAGAYWRGDHTKPQLQRIYGTVWPSREELDLYLHRQEEAKKRDHRRVGREMGLFLFHEWAPGAVFWLPHGEDIYNTLASRMRALLAGSGYQVVRTPLVFDKKLFETSGHWEHYQENLFHFPEGHHRADDLSGDDDVESGRTLGLKPMNCPCHMLIFRSEKRSYRELPLRLYDQGVLHRNELSGTLSGLTRVRQFCQDDAHIFCTEAQIADEVAELLRLVDRIYSAFDMRYEIYLSTRPDKKLGDDALWDQAEEALREALTRSGRNYRIKEGDGAFYGPKIDFDIFDALERSHQCATIQLDFQLPRRFDLSYVGADNTPHTPVVIHRAIMGSFERFIGILIEHYAGKFPVWLAPEQARVMTVSEKSLSHGRAVLSALKEAGIKASLDDNDSKIGYKIRVCHGKKVPYMVVIGETEQAEGTVSIRSRDHGDLGSMPVAEFVEKCRAETQVPF
jgi:threonyl-tRNA synthetase